MTEQVNVTVDLSGLRALERRLPGNADRLLGELAMEFVQYVKTHWSPQSPSAPGTPPAIDTGMLTNSIDTVVIMRGKEWRVVVKADYGPYLEFGTPRMAARPFMRPAAFFIRQRVPEKMRELFR